MNSELVRVVGSTGQDNLIARLTPPAETFGIKVAAGEGVLARGTVLAVNSAGKYVIAGTADSSVSCILADPVDASDTTEDATAVAYRSGNFNRAALIVKSGYTLTAADEDALRKYDIIFTDMMN